MSLWISRMDLFIQISGVDSWKTCGPVAQNYWCQNCMTDIGSPPLFMSHEVIDKSGIWDGEKLSIAASPFSNVIPMSSRSQAHPLVLPARNALWCGRPGTRFWPPRSLPKTGESGHFCSTSWRNCWHRNFACNLRKPNKHWESLALHFWYWDQWWMRISPFLGCRFGSHWRHQGSQQLKIKFHTVTWSTYFPNKVNLVWGIPICRGKAYRKGPGVFVAHWEVRDADELNEVDRSTLILEAVWYGLMGFGLASTWVLDPVWGGNVSFVVSCFSCFRIPISGCLQPHHLLVMSHHNRLPESLE